MYTIVVNIFVHIFPVPAHQRFQTLSNDVRDCLYQLLRSVLNRSSVV